MKKLKVVLTIVALLVFFVVAAPTRCTPDPTYKTPVWHIWTLQPTRTPRTTTPRPTPDCGGTIRICKTPTTQGK